MCGNLIVNCIGYYFKVELWWLGCHESCNDIVDTMYPYWIENSIECEFKNFYFENISHVLHELIMYLNEFTRWVTYIAWDIMVQFLLKSSWYLIISGLFYNFLATQVLLHMLLDSILVSINVTPQNRNNILECYHTTTSYYRHTDKKKTAIKR
jgi:hypothetical protein